jgi:hypothetical protein
MSNSTLRLDKPVAVEVDEDSTGFFFQLQSWLCVVAAEITTLLTMRVNVDIVPYKSQCLSVIKHQGDIEVVLKYRGRNSDSATDIVKKPKSTTGMHKPKHIW